jgi:hypothetical protein
MERSNSIKKEPEEGGMLYNKLRKLIAVVVSILTSTHDPPFSM